MKFLAQLFGKKPAPIERPSAEIEKMMAEKKAREEAERAEKLNEEDENKRHDEMIATVAGLRGMTDEEFAAAVGRGREVITSHGGFMGRDLYTETRWGHYNVWRNAVAEELALRALLKGR